jgi:tetratricopeptide (TPR) repeat protein
VEANLREKLPTDIIWKRVIPYEEFIDISEQLIRQIANCPKNYVSQPIDDFGKDPALVKRLILILESTIKDFEELMKKARIDGVISSKKIYVDDTTEAKLEVSSRKISHLEQLVGNDGSAKHLFLRGNYYLHQEMFKDAIDIYNQFLNTFPENLEALSNMGIACRKLGKLEKAIELFDKALKIQPDNSLVLVNKGVTLINAQKPDAAIKLFDEVLLVDPFDELALFNKGCALASLGLHNESIFIFDKVLKSDPNNPESLLFKAEELILSDRIDEGLEIASKARIRAKNSTDKAVALLLETFASVLLNKTNQIKRKTGEFKKLIKDLETDGKMFDYNYGFSFIERAATKKKLSERYKQKIFSMISILKNS